MYFSEFYKNLGFASTIAGISYLIFRNDFLKSSKSSLEAKLKSALFVFTSCSVLEFVQKINLPFIRDHHEFIGNTYDSKDFLAYALGIGIILSGDLIYGRLKSKNF